MGMTRPNAAVLLALMLWLAPVNTMAQEPPVRPAVTGPIPVTRQRLSDPGANLRFVRFRTPRARRSVAANTGRTFRRTALVAKRREARFRHATRAAPRT